MPRAKSPMRLEAERLVTEFPDTPSRTLAARLAKSHKIKIEAARTTIRVCRGNSGKLKRHRAVAPRENQPAGWTPQMPPSLAEKWESFDLGNEIRVAILSDVHVPYHSPIAVKAAVDNAKKRKPNVLLLNGDMADFYSISRHQKDPSKRDLEQEITAVREMLAWLRHEFGKNCRIVYKLGNHEERWQHWLWNAAPEISNSPRMNVKEWIDADKYGVEVVGDQRSVMVGKLPVLHGHEAGKTGLTSSVNSARGLFLKTLSTMLVGHGHRTSQHAETDWQHKQTSTWSTGCLCEMNPEYWRVGNKWNWGAAFVEVDKSGEYHVDNFRIGPVGEIW